MVVVAISVPEVPVMPMVELPVAAVLLAVSVRVLVPVLVGLGLKPAVTPLGRPEAARVTLPLNPLAGVTTMELVLLLPWVTDKVGAV
jgi:hypothetical protein